MNITQVSIGRFHHFHLARQMERLGLLEKIYTGYPFFKLKEEHGIPKNKIKTFPWSHTPYMKRGKLGLDRWEWLNKEWEWLSKQSIDKYVAKQIKSPTVLIALSGNGLHAGKKTKLCGGVYICDRGSSHIRFQDQILIEEYKKWGFDFKGVDQRIIEKEEEEYQQADIITIPSEFVKQSFLQMGVPEYKIKKVVYGAYLERFQKTGEPPQDKFRVLWVGGVSIRKGFMYALNAFQKLNHPKKEFLIVGGVSSEIKELMQKQNLDGVKFLGNIANAQLPDIYSTAHVFVLPSLEEGLAMVQGEALACGCPVIATTNSGAEDIFTDSHEGFIVPIRSSDLIAERLQQFIDNPYLRDQMSEACVKKVKSLGGWNSYGDNYKKVIDEYNLNNILL